MARSWHISTTDLRSHLSSRALGLRSGRAQLEQTGAPPLLAVPSSPGAAGTRALQLCTDAKQEVDPGDADSGQGCRSDADEEAGAGADG